MRLKLVLLVMGCAAGVAAPLRQVPIPPAPILLVEARPEASESLFYLEYESRSFERDTARYVPGPWITFRLEYSTQQAAEDARSEIETGAAAVLRITGLPALKGLRILGPRSPLEGIEEELALPAAMVLPPTPETPTSDDVIPMADVASCLRTDGHETNLAQLPASPVRFVTATEELLTVGSFDKPPPNGIAAEPQAPVTEPRFPSAGEARLIQTLLIGTGEVRVVSRTPQPRFMTIPTPASDEPNPFELAVSPAGPTDPAPAPADNPGKQIDVVESVE